MKFKKFNFFNAKWFLILGLFLSSLSANAQNLITLYETTFEEWPSNDMTTGNSSASISYEVTPGRSFAYVGKPGFFPAENKICSANSTNTLIFPTFDFIGKGIIEMDWTVAKNGKGMTLNISGATAEIVSTSTEPDKPSNGPQVSGASIKTGKNYGKYTVRYTFNANSNTVAEFSNSMKCEEVAINRIKVLTDVGTNPYVFSPTYPNAGADGSRSTQVSIIKGEVGGPQVSGTVDVQSYNLAGKKVKLEIIGANASRFTLPATEIDAPTAATNVTINYTPSVRAGAHDALLKLSADGAPDYYVNILGQTGSGAPQIVASTAQLNFWTSLIAPREQVLRVSGLNLTGPLTLSVVGAGADRFTLSTNTLSVLEASKGYDLNISFLGEILENEVGLDATLELSSPGAAPVSIPLKGITSGVKPVLYNFTFEVQPAGTAFVDCNLGGTVFLEGTVLNATVTLENGYRINRWSDNAGTTKAQRSFKVTENKHIVIFTEKGIQIEGPTTTDVQAFVPLTPANITTTSMTLQWTPQENNAGGYTVNVYNADGSLFKTLTSTTTSVLLDGLTEDTEYNYEVVGDNGVLAGAASNPKIGPFRTAKTVVPAVCGENIINQ